MNLFPAELRELPQWCVATLNQLEEGKQDKAPYNPRTGGRASTTDPSTWGTLEEALATCQAWRETSAPNAEVGFVFHTTDPFSVIDLDTYKAKTDQTRTLHKNILDNADTYAEHSQSGLGTHIIGRGHVATGANNEANSLEVYSQARFMICTGKPVGGLAKPIADIQELLNYMEPLLHRKGTLGAVDWRDLGPGEDSGLTDAEVIERASNADNGDKFDRLCDGDLSDYGGDHSDADAALIQWLCFYSSDNEQVRRLFLMSKLADRDKAHRPDYIPRTIANMRARLEAEKIPEVDATALAERARSIAAGSQAPQAPNEGQADDAAPDVPKVPALPPIAASDVTFPDGLVGRVAQYVLSASTRPVPEIALATAIAVVAGIVGRNYNISNTGLNQYLLLLAKTGTGKESVQSTVDRLFVEVQKSIPAAEQFVGPAHFASGQALVKSFQERPCFMSVLGEFGHRMQAMSHPRANSAEKTLMAAILDIFGKSGWGQMLRPSVYSDREKNTAMVHAPALTLLGEAEPESFFAALDESTVASGFLPRFLVIEYKGERPKRNKGAWKSPPAELVKEVADLCASTLSMAQNGTCTTVQLDAGALQLLDGFDEYADNEMRGSPLVTQFLWNRAHLKALRLAALVAVGCNPYDATVTAEHAQWAIDMVRRDTSTLLLRFERGDVGEGDSKLLSDLTTVIQRYLVNPGDKWDEYHAKGCIPMRLLQQRTSNRAAFKNHRMGANRALKDTLASMVDTGLLVQIARKQAEDWFKTSSVVYGIGDHWETD